MNEQLTDSPTTAHPMKKIPESQMLLDVLPGGIYSCDKDGKITFFNHQATQLWGHTPALNNDDVRFCAFHKVWLPDGASVSPAETPMAITLSTGSRFRNVEALVEKMDGSQFYASINTDPIFDSDGNLTGAIGFFQDISRHTQTEHALRESEQRYRMLIHNLDVPLYTTDAHGLITMYNAAAADLWGREPEIGKDKWCGSDKLFYADGSELLRENSPMAACLHEGRGIKGTEILIGRPDGSIRSVSPHPQPMFDENGGLTGAVNMLIDITNLKQTEVALRESEQKYRELVSALERMVEEKSHDLLLKNKELKESEERYHRMIEEVEDYAIILMDPNGIIRNWNKGAEKIKGYTDEEVIGKSFELFYLDEDRKNGLPRRLIEQARTHGKALSEGWRRKKDGNIFWASIVITAIRDDKNELIGFTKVTRDLTERKMAEDKLREYSNRLEFQNRELEQFAYAASHDMKEPLRKIHLYYSYIADNPGNKLDEKSRDYLNRSVNSITRMNNLIEDLLAYSRATSDNEGFTNVDLNDIVSDILAEHTDDVETFGIKVSVEKLPVIKGVPFLCKQLMDNIIKNAFKYRDKSRQSEISITSSKVNASEVTNANARPYRQYYRVSVADNGVGFEPQYAEKIFEVFQRLNTSRETHGSGIGLAICRKIVQHHNGIIKATGEPGQGATFDIYFPVSR